MNTKQFFLMCAGMLVLHFSNGQPGQQPVKQPIFALTNATIVDANHRQPLPDQTVLIKDNMIVGVFPSATRLSDTIPAYNCKGKFVIPGLIDAHVHIDQESPAKAERDTAEFYLRKLLLSGVTSVRDMNGDARFLACLSRDAKTGDIASPDICYSAVMAGPQFFAEERVRRNPYAKGGVPGQMPYWKLLTDSTDLVQAMAEAKGCGATGVKFYTDIPNDILVKATREAKRQGLRVWSHAAIIPANALEATNAGVQVISHADGLVRECRGDVPFPDAWKAREKPDQSDVYWNRELKNLKLDDLLARMKELNTIFDPTLSVFTMFRDMPGQRWRFEVALRVIREAHKAGVKICAGTDTDLRRWTVQKEMQYLVQYCNFSPIDALVSATRIGAEALGIEGTCGTVEVNKSANLVVLDKSPVDDISNIGSVNMVIKSGVVYKGISEK